MHIYVIFLFYYFPSFALNFLYYFYYYYLLLFIYILQYLSPFPHLFIYARYVSFAATQLTVSKVTAYIQIVVNTRLKENANEASRQKRLDAGEDLFPMTEAEKVRNFHVFFCIIYILQCVVVIIYDLLP